LANFNLKILIGYRLYNFYVSW